MKLFKRLITCVTVCCLVFASAVTVNASTTSTISVTTSSGSAYSSETATIVGASHSSGTAKLKSFKFSSWCTNSMPYNSQGEYYRINVRFYSGTTAVSDVAHYNCANQNKTLAYNSGCGSVGATYRLKTNSSYSETYYATFEWNV